MTTARGIRGRRAMRTVGHSTRPMDALLDLLRAQEIKRVMDGAPWHVGGLNGEESVGSVRRVADRPPMAS